MEAGEDFLSQIGILKMVIFDKIIKQGIENYTDNLLRFFRAIPLWFKMVNLFIFPILIMAKNGCVLD